MPGADRAAWHRLDLGHQPQARGVVVGLDARSPFRGLGPRRAEQRRPVTPGGGGACADTKPVPGQPGPAEPALPVLGQQGARPDRGQQGRGVVRLEPGEGRADPHGRKRVLPGEQDQAGAGGARVAGQQQAPVRPQADRSSPGIIADGHSRSDLDCGSILSPASLLLPGCGHMYGINDAAPDAQVYVDSWADEFASWGCGLRQAGRVGTGDVPDVEAWSAALRQTGRPIILELSNNLALSGAAQWSALADGWRTGTDIECYSCEKAAAERPRLHRHLQHQHLGVADVPGAAVAVRAPFRDQDRRPVDRLAAARDRHLHRHDSPRRREPHLGRPGPVGLIVPGPARLTCSVPPAPLHRPRRFTRCLFRPNGTWFSASRHIRLARADVPGALRYPLI